MHRSLLRNLTSSTSPNSNRLISSFAASVGPVQLSWFSSKTGSSSETNNFDTLNKSGCADDSCNRNDEEVQPVSSQEYLVAELKRRIEKFYEGDEEALPSLFEAILRRKLTGIKDDDEGELMKELGLINNPSLDTSEDEEFDSDVDDDSDSDSDSDSETDGDFFESLGYPKDERR